jgi:hypothetical protein
MGNIHTSSTPYNPPVSTLDFTLIFNDDASWFDDNVNYTLVLQDASYINGLYSNKTFTNFRYVSPNELYFSNVNSDVAGNLVYVLSDTKGNTYQGTLNIQLICYGEGTKILCKSKNDNEEEYVKIEDIDNDRYIKTYLHGYKKVHSISSNILIHNNNILENKKYFLYEMYELKKDSIKKDEPFENLYVTGGHSILVDKLSKKEEIFLKQFWDKPQKIDDKILLLSSGCDLFTKYTENKTTKVYHIALESDDIKQHYGIYANGILSESISIHDIQYLHTIKVNL